MVREFRWKGGREGETEWFMGWGERQIWRGEGDEEWADVNGLLAT